MRFVITRTSCYGDEDVKPCDEAFKNKYIRIDIRHVGKPENVPFYRGNSDWWYNEGTNHRTINGRIARDFEDEAWFIELDSLEDLLEFQNKVGHRIIISGAFNDSEYREIEIYDDYRE